MKIVSLFQSRQFSITDAMPLDARALFERVIPNFSADRARPLWERWARYEYQYGDLEAALKLEKRMAEVYASGIILYLKCYSDHLCLLLCFFFSKRSSYQTVRSTTYVFGHRCDCRSRSRVCYGSQSDSY